MTALPPSFSCFWSTTCKAIALNSMPLKSGTAGVWVSKAKTMARSSSSSPRKAAKSGKVTISTGYGIEQYVTDATAKRIIEREMIPAFKENDYYTGIDNAVNVMMDLCSGKFTQDEYNDEDGIPGWLTLLFIIAIIVVFTKFSNGGGQSYSGGGTRTIWIPMGGGGFSGGGFGGGSSGGFGGFGGGGFGGGGASGSW